MQSRSIAPRRAPSWPVELVTRRSTWSWAVRRPRRCRPRSARASSCRPRTSSSRWSSRRNLWGRRSSRTSRLKRLSACTACPPRRERDTRTGCDARTALDRSHARTHARKRARARGIAIPPQSLRGVGPLRFVRGLRLFIAPSRRRRADAESCRARATWPPDAYADGMDGRTDRRSIDGDCAVERARPRMVFFTRYPRAVPLDRRRMTLRRGRSRRGTALSRIANDITCAVSSLSAIR